MHVKVENSSTQLEVGDIFAYEKSTTGNKQPYYMICFCEHDEKYFMINLSGIKSRMKFYNGISQLRNSISDTIKIYSKEEFDLNIARK